MQAGSWETVIRKVATHSNFDTGAPRSKHVKRHACLNCFSLTFVRFAFLHTFSTAIFTAAFLSHFVLFSRYFALLSIEYDTTVHWQPPNCTCLFRLRQADALSAPKDVVVHEYLGSKVLALKMRGEEEGKKSKNTNSDITRLTDWRRRSPIDDTIITLKGHLGRRIIWKKASKQGVGFFYQTRQDRLACNNNKTLSSTTTSWSPPLSKYVLVWGNNIVKAIPR